MIKKDAQDLIERLDDIHARLEDIIQDYMNEYAAYGWDATCTDIVNIAASVDCVTLQLKYATNDAFYCACGATEQTEREGE